jgi:hypothetical protein
MRAQNEAGSIMDAVSPCRLESWWPFLHNHFPTALSLSGYACYFLGRKFFLGFPRYFRKIPNKTSLRFVSWELKRKIITIILL